MNVNLRPGNVLPLAMAMTSMVLLAGLGIGTVVLDGLKRSQEIDRSVSAYYMADSGIERQLYEVRKRSISLADLANVSSSYPNGSSWTYFGDYETLPTKEIAQIPVNQSVVLDLFDPDDAAIPGYDGVVVQWNVGDDCGIGQSPKVEVGSVAWDLSAGSFSDQFRLQLAPAGDVGMTVNLDPLKAHRLRIRSYVCGMKNVEVSVQQSGSTVPFPGDIQLAAEGTVSQATQKIFVTMPRLDVLSDVFSFVVFSECSLVKSTGQTPVCPP